MIYFNKKSITQIKNDGFFTIVFEYSFRNLIQLLLFSHEVNSYLQ